ncbi:MAG TPA: shikimate kinase [Cyclobacteriaceae bacterium]|nr:shikimate kinase [Cyclobacteriaceae bacterium]
MGKVKIVLVGLPGSGKSTFGSKLALQLEVPFYDLDELIVLQEGKSIPEIFQEKGEGYFRQAETRALEEKLKSDDAMVLATGGGAPCFNDNMERINRRAISVFMDVPLPQIIGRMTVGEVALRPLFQGLDTGEIAAKLTSLYADRLVYYDQAKIKLSGDDISTELLISELLTFFRS